MPVSLRRVYDPPTSGDGVRILVDRLWPRGLTKQKAHVDLWAKEVAPSPELRKWFSHLDERWPEFRKRYLAELRANQDALEPIRKAAKSKPVTLLFGARNDRHNSAVVLKEYLEHQPARSKRPQ